MGCCDDPTEPVKISRIDLVQAQEQYGNLIRDLFTSDPEKLMLKQLHGASTYLIELAALNAHYDSVRKQAIAMLNKDSISAVKRIAEKDANTEIGDLAKLRIGELENDSA